MVGKTLLLCRWACSGTVSIEVVESSSLEVLGSHLDATLSHVLQDDPAWARRLDQMAHYGPSQPDPFCNSVKPVPLQHSEENISSVERQHLYFSQEVHLGMNPSTYLLVNLQLLTDCGSLSLRAHWKLSQLFLNQKISDESGTSSQVH